MFYEQSFRSKGGSAGRWCVTFFSSASPGTSPLEGSLKGESDLLRRVSYGGSYPREEVATTCRRVRTQKFFSRAGGTCPRYVPLVRTAGTYQHVPSEAGTYKGKCWYVPGTYRHIARYVPPVRTHRTYSKNWLAYQSVRTTRTAMQDERRGKM